MKYSKSFIEKIKIGERQIQEGKTTNLSDYLQELKYGRQKLDDEIIDYFNSLPDELEKARKIIKTARKFTISKSRVYTAIKFKIS
jgi:hypothetical protein